MTDLEKFTRQRDRLVDSLTAVGVKTVLFNAYSVPKTLPCACTMTSWCFSEDFCPTTGMSISQTLNRERLLPLVPNQLLLQGVEQGVIHGGSLFISGAILPSTLSPIKHGCTPIRKENALTYRGTTENIAPVNR
jgi:hypothetical protein